MITATPRVVTGHIFVEGKPQNITGFPVFMHHAGDWRSGTSLAIVDLLTEDGVLRTRAFAPAFDMLGVPIKTLSAMSDPTLWGIADRDWVGFGALALAELARRENALNREAECALSDRLSKSRRDADALMGR